MGGKHTQIFKVTTCHGMDPRVADENQRNWSEEKWEAKVAKGRYDRSRERLNFEIARGRVQEVDKSRSICQRIKDDLAARGIKDPNAGRSKPNRVTLVNIIFQGTRERMHEMAFEGGSVNLARWADNSHITRKKDIEEWALDIHGWTADHWGSENIASFIVHLDETNPHIHCSVLPIRDGKFCYRKTFPSGTMAEWSKGMKALHDDLARVNARWGLERGVDFDWMNRRWVDPEEYWRSLLAKSARLEEQMGEQREAARALGAGIAGMCDHEESLERSIASRREALAALEREMGDLDRVRDERAREARDLGGRAQALRDAIESAQRESLLLAGKVEERKRQLQEMLARAESRAREAERAEARLKTRLADIKAMDARIHALDGAVAERRARLEALDEGIHGLVANRVMEALGERTIGMMEALYAKSEALREALAGTEEGEALRMGPLVRKCAGLLAIGMPDRAREAAMAGGGGGLLPDGWGRPEGEDEASWIRRCAETAVAMARPSHGNWMKR